LQVSKDNLEIILPVLFAGYMGIVVFVTASISVLFYYEHEYVLPILSSSGLVNVIIIGSIGYAVYANLATTVLVICVAAIYVNSANIWLKYLR